MATLYHPTLKRTIVVSDKAVPTHEKAGWTTQVPKSHQSDQPVNVPASEEGSEHE